MKSKEETKEVMTKEQTEKANKEEDMQADNLNQVNEEAGRQTEVKHPEQRRRTQ